MATKAQTKYWEKLKGKKPKNMVGLALGSIWNKGKKKPSMAGKKHPNWKGGLPACPECKETVIKYKSKRCKKCWGKSRGGSNESNWKGGITSLIEQIRHSFKYRQWRSDVFTRDRFTCVVCDIMGVELNADHFPKSFAEIFHQYKPKSLEESFLIEEFWNINNGRTLCVKCHKKTITYLKRS